MITLVHCGTESLYALEGALERLGFDSCRAGRPDQAAPAGPVILLGAGPMEPVSALLKRTGWWRELPQLAADGRAVLGINVGLHILAEGSEESPRGTGLGLIPGIVRRLGPGVKMPHWGWSPVRQQKGHPLFPEIRGGWLFFSHSHGLEPTSETLAVAVHGRPFSVLECRGRAVGIQAHLEKSGCFGLALLGKTLCGLGERPGPERTPDSN
jgi:imidazole glycerol phosphate synthase glutamine amidotransferase subunit